MILFVKKFKQEVLGVGEVALPGEGTALKEAAAQRVAKEVKDRSDKTDVVQQQNQSANSSIASSAVNGTNDKTEYVSKLYKEKSDYMALIHGLTQNNQLQQKLFPVSEPNEWCTVNTNK